MSGAAGRLEGALRLRFAATVREWRWLAFGTWLAWIGAALWGAVLVLAAAWWRWPAAPLWVGVLVFVLLCLLAAFAALVAAIVTAAVGRRPGWTAGQLERANPSMLDRLHALVGAGAGTPAPEPYLARIREQAERELNHPGDPFGRERRRRRRSWWVCVLLAIAAMVFVDRARPWTRYQAPVRAAAEASAPELGEPEAAAAEVAAVEQEPPWAEVRITEPARDLTVTKVDAVPLTIEVAANRRIEDARWATAVTGEPARDHPLPPPAEPRYALYRPTVYVDEFGLSDWDVLAYHARASSGGGEHRSQIYFLEVRPFREQIRRLPGGEGGQCYDLLKRLSALIERQKHVLRETHGLAGDAGRGAAERRTDRDKLAAAERDLAAASRHLYAEFAAELEHAAIGPVLDHLARAEGELEAAAEAVGADPEAALVPEQAALAELVATRKAFDRFVAENPGAFDGGGGPEQEPVPIADPEERLREIAEYRDRRRAAIEALERIAAEQDEIAGELEAGADPAELVDRQRSGRRELAELDAVDPALDRETGGIREQAGASLERAGEAMAAADERSAELQRRGAADVERLRAAAAAAGARRALAEAYRLRELIGRLAERLGEIESAPEGRAAADLEPLADTSRRAVAELERRAASPEISELFGPELRRALERPDLDALDAGLDSMCRAGAAAGRGAAAGASRRRLEEVAAAFDEAAPEVVEALAAADPLDDPAGAFDRALAQLRGLAARGGGGPTGAGYRAEVLETLRRGLEERGVAPERRAALLAEADRALARLGPELDASLVEGLVSALELLRFEAPGDAAEGAAEADPEVALVDPESLPAAYRERIQTYLRRLSEREP